MIRYEINDKKSRTLIVKLNANDFIKWETLNLTTTTFAKKAFQFDGFIMYSISFEWIFFYASVVFICSDIYIFKKFPVLR